jgi:hypothetical protein
MSLCAISNAACVNCLATWRSLLTAAVHICVLSYEAVAELRRHGFKAVRLEDGYPEWRAAGLPVEHSANR